MLDKYREVPSKLKMIYFNVATYKMLTSWLNLGPVNGHNFFQSEDAAHSWGSVRFRSSQMVI